MRQISLKKNKSLNMTRMQKIDVKKEIPSEGLVHDRDKGQLGIRADLKEKISHVLISSTYIKKRIKDLSAEIVKDAKLNKAHELQIVIVLKGATAFANDLAQEIFKRKGPAVRFNYIKASSYGEDLSSSGTVSISGQMPYVKNKNLLIVEDIVDTGKTLAELRKYLIKERGASSVKICAFLDKRARRLPGLKKDLHIDYVGFKVPNIFVAGYGIDCAEEFRELPYIVAVKEDYFKAKKKRK